MLHSFIPPLQTSANSAIDFENKVKQQIERKFNRNFSQYINFYPEKFFLSSDTLYMAFHSLHFKYKIEIYRYHLPDNDLAPLQLEDLPQINALGHFEVFLRDYIFFTESSSAKNYAYIHHMQKKKTTGFSIKNPVSKIIISPNKQRIYFNDSNKLKMIEVAELFEEGSFSSELRADKILVVYEHKSKIANFEVSYSEQVFVILDEEGSLQLYFLETNKFQSLLKLDKKCVNYMMLHKSNRIMVQTEHEFCLITCPKRLPFINQINNCIPETESAEAGKNMPGYIPPKDCDAFFAKIEEKKFASIRFLNLNRIVQWSFCEENDLLIIQIPERIYFEKWNSSEQSLEYYPELYHKFLINFFHVNGQNSWIVYQSHYQILNSFCITTNLKDSVKIRNEFSKTDTYTFYDENNVALFVVNKSCIAVYDVDSENFKQRKIFNVSGLLDSEPCLATCSEGTKLFFSSTKGDLYCFIDQKEHWIFDFKNYSKNGSVLKFKVCNYQGCDNIYSYFEGDTNIYLLHLEKNNFRLERTISLEETYPISDIFPSLKHQLIFVKSKSILVLDKQNAFAVRALHQFQDPLNLIRVDHHQNLLVCLDGCTIIVWELPSLTILRKQVVHHQISSIIGLKNGLLITAGEESLCFWNIEDLSFGHSYKLSNEKVELPTKIIYNEYADTIFLMKPSVLDIEVIEMKNMVKINRLQSTKIFPQFQNYSSPDTYKQLSFLAKSIIQKYISGSTLSLLSEKNDFPNNHYWDLLKVDSFHYIIGVTNKSVEYWHESDPSNKQTIFEAEDIDEGEKNICRVLVFENCNTLIIFYEKDIKRYKIYDKTIEFCEEITFRDDCERITMCENSKDEILFLGHNSGIYLFDYKNWRSIEQIFKFGELSHLPKNLLFIKYLMKSKRLIVLSEKSASTTCLIFNFHNKKLKLVHSIDLKPGSRAIEISAEYELLLRVTNSNEIEIFDLFLMREFTVNVQKEIQKILVLQIDEDFEKDKLFIHYEDKNGQQWLTVYDMRNLFKLCNFEQQFLRDFTSLSEKKITKTEFSDFFKKWKIFYMSSYTLQRFYNIYLLASICGQVEIFKHLYLEQKIPFEFFDRQIDCLQCILHKSNNYFQLRKLLKFMNNHGLYLEINNRFFQMLLSEHQDLGYTFLRKACINIHAFEDSKVKIPLQDQYRHKINIISDFRPKYNMDIHERLLRDRKSKARTIVIYNLHIKMNFDEFTENSILLLKCYLSCDSDEFILSPYRHIITSKWSKLYPFFLGQALVYWLFFIFYFLYLMNPSTLGLFITAITALTLLFAYEIMAILCNFKAYIGNFWNFIDFIIYSSGYLFLIVSLCLEQETLLDIEWNIFMMASMCLACIRGFSYFKVFNASAHLIQMSIKMIRYSVVILFFIGYFIVCFAVMVSKSLAGSYYVENLYDFFNLVFGNLPENMQQKAIPFQIIVVIGSLLIPIFFINLLIAKLSSSFNDLESRQKVLEFLEKADSILELELIGQKLISIWKRKFIKQADIPKTSFNSFQESSKKHYDAQQKSSQNIYLAVDKSEIFEEEVKPSFDKLVDIMTKQQDEFSRLYQNTQSDLSNRFDEFVARQEVAMTNIENQIVVLKADLEKKISKSQNEVTAYLARTVKIRSP